MLLTREALSHVSHSYGFSLICIIECWFMLLTREALSHVSHSYGFSLVCIIECWFRLLTREALSHYHTRMISLRYVLQNVGLCY